MPIVATVKFDLLDMAVLLCWFAPSKHHSLEGREHGRTIPLAVIRPVGSGREFQSPIKIPMVEKLAA
jgi:hypothetical protein